MEGTSKHPFAAQVADAFGVEEPSGSYGKSQNANAAVDRLVLLHVMHAIGAATFLKSKRWGSDDNLARWYGVETNAKGRVVGLGLSNFKATSTLPKSIGRLKYLERLALRGNAGMTGELPCGPPRPPRGSTSSPLFSSDSTG